MNKPTHRLLSARIFIFRRYSCEKIEGRTRALCGIFESAVLFGEGKCVENKNILPKNKTVLDTFDAKSIVKEFFYKTFCLDTKSYKKIKAHNQNSIVRNPTHRLLSAWIFIFRRYSREKIEGRARALRGILTRRSL